MPLFTDALNALQTAGFSDESLPGILANIDVETGGTFDYQQQQDGGNGYGLFQFDSQKEPYYDWLEATGKEDSDLSQASFVYDALYSKDPYYDIGYGHRRKLRNTLSGDDVDAMTSEFMKRYERPGVPHLEERLESGRKFQELLRRGMLTGN